MRSIVQANRYVVLRLPSDALKLVEVLPDTVVSIGKYGSFPSNLLIGQPLYATYEIIEQARAEEAADSASDATPNRPKVRLRIVPAAELNQEATYDTGPAGDASNEDAPLEAAATEDLAASVAVVRNNQHTVDDGSRQTLSMAEIEEIKKASNGNGKEVIERILSGHKNLNEKTLFSLAKYTLRKAKKFLRRFTVLPMDPGRLIQYYAWDRDVARIMELREEALGMITSWSNVHHTPPPQSPVDGVDGDTPVKGVGRWLVIDDTGGLIVAAMAEKLGILYPEPDRKLLPETQATMKTQPHSVDGNSDDAQAIADDPTLQDTAMPDADHTQADAPHTDTTRPIRNPKPRHPPRFPTVAHSNTIHVLHAPSQPNINLLKYFSFDANHPTLAHPLSTHLLPISWLQLLHPEEDKTYAEPAVVPQAELEQLKAAKRSTYHRKRRRWQRCRDIVDGAREGGFDGLVCATSMAPASYLRHLVPLVKGGGHVVLYSPTVERLAGAVDLYSRERRAAYLELLDEWRVRRDAAGDEEDPGEFRPDERDFPVDPRLLLGCTVLTSTARQWQVLPGRTHPVMTAKGGGEGYVFTARRVIPFEGKVEARGNFAKKRKTAPS